MPSIAGSHATDYPGIAHADFVLGDRDGTTCDPAFTARVAETLRGMGYDVRINDPYKGVELVRAFSDPKAGRHSLQIEVNRRLYMDERTRARNAGFAELQRNLDRLLHQVADYAEQHGGHGHHHDHDHDHGHGHHHHDHDHHHHDRAQDHGHSHDHDHHRH
jgi:N-formylglutamate deformylase